MDVTSIIEIEHLLNIYFTFFLGKGQSKGQARMPAEMDIRVKVIYNG